MLHFWLEVLFRALRDTLAGIGKDPAELRFSIFVFVLVTLVLLIKNRKKGLRAWVENVKRRFWRIVGEDIAIILGVIVLILIYNILREPYLAWDGERQEKVQAKSQLDGKESELIGCTGDLKTEQVRSQLLGNQVTAQQTQIAGQQTTSATQQSTFNLCVTTLAKSNAPVPQLTTILGVLNDPRPDHKTKHSSLILIMTNRDVTPVRLLLTCAGEIKEANVRPFGNEPYSAQMVRAKVSANPFTAASNVWLVSMSTPVWSPNLALLVTLDHDVDDLGVCSVN